MSLAEAVLKNCGDPSVLFKFLEETPSCSKCNNRSMNLIMIPKVLVTIILVTGCSSGEFVVVNSTTTTATDKLTSLLSRVDDAVSKYVERSVLQRPELLSRTTEANLLACALSTSKEIAQLIYLNRTGRTPLTTSGTDSEALTEMVINEATTAVQSQIEPILARCAQGS